MSAAPVSISVHDEIAPLAAEWDELAEELGASPFMRPGWLSAWWGAFGAGRLAIHAARRSGRLCGILPLRAGHGTLVSTTNWHTGHFEPLAVDAPTRSSLAETALRGTRRRLDLAPVADGDLTVGALRGRGAGAGYRAILRTVQRSPYVPLTGTWEAYEGGRGGRLRRELGRRRRRLEESGQVEFECDDGSERLAELLRDGLAVEAAGWKGREGTAIIARESTRRFYEDLARWAAKAGLLRLWFLRLDGQPIAFAYCLVDSEAHYVLKVGFEPSTARFAPGLLLTREMLAGAFEGGLQSYEFLGGTEDYKLVWANDFHDRIRLQLFPPSVAGALDHVVWKQGRDLAKRLRRR